MATTKTKYRRTTKSIQVKTLGLAERLALVERSTMINELPNFNPGDTVRVHVRIKEGEKERVQAYEGVVVGRQNKGASKSFRVRKMSHGVGVERIFLETSPKIAKLEVVQSGRVRRAKLYYLRGLEGKAAKIERQVETLAAAAAKAAAKSGATAAKTAAKSKAKSK